MERTAMPIIAGILAIVSGGFKLLGFLGLIMASSSGRVFIPDMSPETGLLIIGIPLAILGVVAIGGGICALQRRYFLWAVLGSTASLLPISCLGLASVILVALSEGEFE